MTTGLANLPLERDALRVIQDIVTEAMGGPLPREAERRVEAVLQALAGGGMPAADSSYSEREVTILFADLRGFSAIAAAYPGEVVLRALNRCFAVLVEIAVRHFGTIDKFMGDAIMVVFPGDPSGPRGHARRAVLCAVEMQIAMRALREQHKDEKLPGMYLGIGISTGEVMAGLVGSDAYRAYTVVGEEVNLAARIEALSLRGQVLMSEATYELAKDFVHAGEPLDVYVKGKAQQMRVREALGVPALGKVVPRQDQRRSPRVNVSLSLDYWRLEKKVVRPQAARGAIRDISYFGLLAQVEQPLPLYSELKLAFDLPCIGARAEDVYARVVSNRSDAGCSLAGLVFTSLDDRTAEQIRLFVQKVLQGDCAAQATDAAALMHVKGDPAPAQSNMRI